MANIMSMVRAKNKVSRNGFDLSKKIATTAKAGELNVMYSRLCTKGDAFQVATKWMTRTRPVNTAAYTRIKEYYDWYFVPLNLLWNKFNVWSTNMLEENQQATSINGTSLLTDKHPYFTVDQINDYLKRVENLGAPSSAYEIGYNNELGFQRHTLSKKLLHSLGYGDYYKDTTNSFNYFFNAEMSPWKLLAYQKIYQDYYRNSQWEKGRPETWNINYIGGEEGSLNIPVEDIDETKYSMFDVRYANWNKDLFMGLLPDSQYGDAASIIMDSNGASGSVTLGDTSDLFFNFQIATRQGDYIYNTVNEGSQIRSGNEYSSGTNVVKKWYDTNIYNENNSSSSGIVSQYLSASTVSRLRTALGLDASSSTSTSSISSAFTILALRQAEALQKYREISGSNPHDFKSQTEAHFGVKVSDAYSDRCKYLGGIDGNIDITEVVNTNITENSDNTLNGADIAGKGVATGNGKISFNTDVDGVLMCIYHARPLLDYSISGIHPDNTKTLFTDYAIPEFDQTGMVQVPLVHLTNTVPDVAGFGNPEDIMLGYAPRYYDYKTDIDEVRGAFYNGSLNYQSWVAPINEEYITNWLTQSGQAVFDGIDSSFMKVNPATLNPIFTQDVDSSVDTDQFLINAYFDVKAVRPLDVNGLPY